MALQSSLRSASKGRLIYSSAPSPRIPDRFSVFPLGGDNSLSYMASKAYSVAEAVDGKIKSEISSIYNQAVVLIDGVHREVRTVVSYVDARLTFTDLPESVMWQFGFSPSTPEECPILREPSVEAVGDLAAKFVPGATGAIYAGRVNLDKYPGGKHFYMVAAKCGNIDSIAQAANLPADRVVARLGSMLGMLATWAGCMMTGAYIDPEPHALGKLYEMDNGAQAPKNAVIGTGHLTVGNDTVRLQNPSSVASSGAQRHSFLARTLQYHALVGSVLHMQYIASNGDITWFWVGGGGKGFVSKHFNNPVAISLDIGMWPDMARSIMAFYADSNVVRKFVGTKPKAIRKLILELIVSTAEKKPLFLQLEQIEQVNNPGANLLRQEGFFRHPENGVKGDD